MAYIHCTSGGSGGGIPPQLQSDMDSVFNKKLGTSTTYPSTSWSKEVNLMGLLPEKTVSGAVASFPDGADDVPLKSATFNIDPTLDGVSEVNVVRSGKNLLPNYITNGTSADIDATVNNDGSVTLDGTSTGWATFDTNTEVLLKAGTYIFSQGQDATLGCYGVLHKKGSLNTVYCSLTGQATGSKTFTLSEDTPVCLALVVQSGKTLNNVTYYPQIELDSAATTYAPYSATTRTISLGQTVYGGSVTVDEDGECDLDVGYGRFLLSDCTGWDTSSTPSSGIWRASLPSDVANTIKYASSDNYPVNAIADDFEAKGYTPLSSADTDKFAITSGFSGRIVIVCHDYSTVEDFLTACGNNRVTYELATPTTSTLTPITPITSALGVNNIWCDTGDSEVTYRAQAVIPVNVTIGVNKPTNSTSIAFSIADESQTLYSETITCDAYGAFTEKTINFTSQERPVSMKIKGVRSQSADIPFFFIEWDGWSITFTANGSNSSYECDKTVNAIL